MATSSRIAAGVSALLLTVVAPACAPLGDPGLSGIQVHNDTETTIWIDEFPKTDANERFKARVDDQTFVLTDECTQRRVEAQTRSGEVIAVLDQEWCPGQIWYVRGQDDSSLEDLR